jgi:16S rRNA processing protein RimM
LTAVADTAARAPVETPWDDLILVGVVGRTHGIRGQVFVNPHTDFADDRFAVGAVLETRLADGARRALEVTSVRFHLGRPVVSFAGIESMDEAERCAGLELRIHPDAQHALPPGHYYHHQLIGCQVVTEDGAEVGRVVEVDGGTGQSRLVVNGDRRRHEIPLADAICTVDIAARRIVVRPPEGLLDL